jgi:hypothetical protein
MPAITLPKSPGILVQHKAGWCHVNYSSFTLFISGNAITAGRIRQFYDCRGGKSYSPPSFHK